MTVPEKSRPVPARPPGTRLVLVAALITCVSLVGMAWGFLSGGLLSGFGWDTVLWLSFAPLLVAIVALMAGRRTYPRVG